MGTTELDRAADEVRAAEDRRQLALRQRDWAALREILDEGFVYHHWHGRTDHREHWLAHLEDYVSYRTERASLTVEVLGNVAVTVGAARNVIVKAAGAEPVTSSVVAIQVWTRAGGAWRQTAHHSIKQPG